MSFIPIDAKADIEGSKKGKLTPAQHSQLNAWCLTKKTGILNCLNKCEATENVYTATNNIATVIFKSGYLAICGRIVECEEGTEVQVITPVSGTQTGYIIARYDLSANEEKEFEIITKTGSLIQQDLNDNPITGIYELLLYSYNATPTSVTLNRNVEYVKSVSDIVPRAVTAKYMEEIYLNPSASNIVDLNDLTEYGVYNIYNYNEQVPYVHNAPEKNVGRIVVSSFLLKETDSSVKTPYNVIKQEYYTVDNYYYRYSSHNSSTGEHTGWTDWVKVGFSTIEERLTRLGFNEVSTTYNFGMEAGTETVVHNEGKIKTEGRFGQINIDYGFDDNKGYYDKDYIMFVSTASKTTTSTINKPAHIPKGLNFVGKINCKVYMSSQGGSGVANKECDYTLKTTEDKIEIGITLNPSAGIAHKLIRIQNRIVFSWSNNIVLP